MEGELLSPRAAINVVVTPSHWITSINIQVDAAATEEPRAGLTWMPRRPHACLPPVRYQDHRQLAATDLQEWLQEQVAVPARVHYGHWLGLNYHQSLGLSLDNDLFSDQQRHTMARRMCNLPSMTVLVERALHRNVHMHVQCLLCSTGLETARHLWECPVQSHEWRPARQRLHLWLNTYIGLQSS